MWALEAGIPVSAGWGKAWRPEVRALCGAQSGEEGRTPGGKVTGKEASEKGSVMSLGVFHLCLSQLAHVCVADGCGYLQS